MSQISHPHRVGRLRWSLAIAALLLAFAAWATWRVLRLRKEARVAGLAASALTADLALLTEEAQLESLDGARPERLREEVGRAERRLDAREFAAARTEETRLSVRIGAALREVGELPRALARLEQAERAALDHLAARPTIADEFLIRTTPPDPETILDAREELARTWLARGDALRALALAPGDSTARRLLLVGEILGALGDVDGERAFLLEAIRNAPATDASLAFVRSDACAALAGREDPILHGREALAAVRPWASRSDPRVALRTYELASALHDLGPRAAEEARQLYAQALETRLERACGDSRALSTHLGNYGLLLKKTGRLQEAEPVLVRALEMRQRLVPGDDRGTATMMNNVGTLMHALGELQAAEETLESALAMRNRLFPRGDRDVAQSLQNLAWLRQDTGRFAEAAELGRKAVAILREIASGDDPDLTIAIDNLGAALTDLEQYSEAEELTREALAIEERLIGGDDSHRAQTLDNLGVILFYRHKEPAEAERHLSAALELRRALYGDGHSTVAETLKHLAWVHERAQDYPRAERRYLEAIQVRRTSSPDIEDLARLQYDLADCVYASGDPGRAVDFYRVALATAMANLPRLADALADVAEGLVVTADKSMRHADAELDLVPAARLVHGDDALPTYARARVVEALCILYYLWSQDPEQAERARSEETYWRARLREIEKD